MNEYTFTEQEIKELEALELKEITFTIEQETKTVTALVSEYEIVVLGEAA